VPVHAPVAVPGFTKNLLSYSMAWNLQSQSSQEGSEIEMTDV
jgi:hypothetical protein